MGPQGHFLTQGTGLARHGQGRFQGRSKLEAPIASQTADDFFCFNRSPTCLGMAQANVGKPSGWAGGAVMPLIMISMISGAAIFHMMVSGLFWR